VLWQYFSTTAENEPAFVFAITSHLQWTPETKPPSLKGRL
jgi:hypothetical protein